MTLRELLTTWESRFASTRLAPRWIRRRDAARARTEFHRIIADDAMVGQGAYTPTGHLERRMLRGESD